MIDSNSRGEDATAAARHDAAARDPLLVPTHARDVPRRCRLDSRRDSRRDSSRDSRRDSRRDSCAPWDRDARACDAPG